MLMSASLLHHFLRSEVVIELGPDAAPHLRWGRCTLPTLLDVEPLRDAAVAAGLDDGALFANFSSRTPLAALDLPSASLLRCAELQRSASTSFRRLRAPRPHVAPPGATGVEFLLGRQLGDACTKSFP